MSFSNPPESPSNLHKDSNPQPDTWLDEVLATVQLWADNDQPASVIRERLDEAKAAIQSKLKAAELAGRISELEKFNSDVLEIEKIGGGWLSDDIAEFAKQVLECNEERLEALRKKNGE